MAKKTPGVAKPKFVYEFGKKTDGNAQMRNLLGGKGANLAEMARIGLPVPPGFTISTDVCTYYYKNRKTYPKTLMADVRVAVGNIEKQLGKKFGDASGFPLLVAVRSGARESMPGMMDTILNLGLNDDTVEALARVTKNERFAWDCYRRFVQMYGDVVLGVQKLPNEDHEPFEAVIHAVKTEMLEKPNASDTELGVVELRELVFRFKKLIKDRTGSDFPSELGGTIPDSKYYDSIYGAGSWKATNVISLSIGQGEIGCTPLHLANLCATMANRGFYYIPHLIRGTENVSIDPKYYKRQYTLVDTSYFPVMVEGMYRAVNSGYGSGATAAVAAVEGLDICGKTGTAQNPLGDDNSVFICFAPKDNPKIAVAAYVEHGSFGARWAAPIASLLVEKYLNGEIGESRRPLEKRVLEGNLLDKVNINGN